MLMPEGDEIELSSEEREALLVALAEADSDDFVDADEFLRDLWGED